MRLQNVYKSIELHYIGTWNIVNFKYFVANDIVNNIKIKLNEL